VEQKRYKFNLSNRLDSEGNRIESEPEFFIEGAALAAPLITSLNGDLSARQGARQTGLIP